MMSLLSIQHILIRSRNLSHNIQNYDGHNRQQNKDHKGHQQLISVD